MVHKKEQELQIYQEIQKYNKKKIQHSLYQKMINQTNHPLVLKNLLPKQNQKINQK